MRALTYTLIFSLIQILQAQAANYTYSTTVDLSSATIQDQGLNSTFAFEFPSIANGFQLAVGDTLSGTITFDQALTLTETFSPTLGSFNGMLGFATSPTSPSNNSESYTLTLNGLRGTTTFANPTSGTASGGGIAAGFGGIFTSDAMSFTGITYSITVNSESVKGLTYVPALLEVSSNFSAASLTPIAAPEPSTYALLIAGFAILLARASVLRRQASRS